MTKRKTTVFVLGALLCGAFFANNGEAKLFQRVHDLEKSIAMKNVIVLPKEELEKKNPEVKRAKWDLREGLKKLLKRVTSLSQKAEPLVVRPVISWPLGSREELQKDEAMRSLQTSQWSLASSFGAPLNDFTAAQFSREPGEEFENSSAPVVPFTPEEDGLLQTIDKAPFEDIIDLLLGDLLQSLQQPPVARSQSLKGEKRMTKLAGGFDQQQRASFRSIPSGQ